MKRFIKECTLRQRISMRLFLFLFYSRTSKYGHGLRYSTKLLVSIKPYMRKFPLEFLCSFADETCRYLVDSKDESITKYVLDATSLPFYYTNTTGIGNVAYIAMFGRSSTTRTLAENLLISCFADQKANLL